MRKQNKKIKVIMDKDTIRQSGISRSALKRSRESRSLYLSGTIQIGNKRYTTSGGIKKIKNRRYIDIQYRPGKYYTAKELFASSIGDMFTQFNNASPVKTIKDFTSEEIKEIEDRLNNRNKEEVI